MRGRREFYIIGRLYEYNRCICDEEKEKANRFYTIGLYLLSSQGGNTTIHVYVPAEQSFVDYIFYIFLKRGVFTLLYMLSGTRIGNEIT